LSLDCELSENGQESQSALLCLVSITNISNEPMNTQKSYLELRGFDDKVIPIDKTLLKSMNLHDKRIDFGEKLAKGDSLIGYRAFLVDRSVLEQLTFSLINLSGAPMTESNVTSVIMKSTDFEDTPIEKTKAVLETEAADLKTQIAPSQTPTSTSTITNTPENTGTPTMTPSPTLTVTPTIPPDQGTVFALQTEIASLKSGTPPSIETETVNITTDISEAPTEPRQLATSTAISDSSIVPAVLSGLANRDAPNTCDEIGWNGLGGNGRPAGDLDDRLTHFAACSGSVAYLLFCGLDDGSESLFGPSSGQVWVICVSIATNVGDSSTYVSLFDFTLIDANSTRHQIDFSAIAAVGVGNEFPTDAISPGQNVTGIVAFSIAKTRTEGNRIEIAQSLDFSGEALTASILLVPLPQIDLSDIANLSRPLNPMAMAWPEWLAYQDERSAA
ncbi:MAG TPA: DUF4352 domain-containing protein, partial [Thermomicrobiales bacterium]|nr:DUF4352 domain-containing protein [Thermomicrobiales bacterium]